MEENIWKFTLCKGKGQCTSSGDQGGEGGKWEGLCAGKRDGVGPGGTALTTGRSSFPGLFSSPALLN